MSDEVTITIDGAEISACKGQTIMQAADAAGVYIPRLCAHKDLCAFGSCRVCTVLVNGRPQAACTQPVTEGMMIENESEDVVDVRKAIVEMLFVEGNHYCMFCEKSGNCELQALAYRFGITAPRYPYMFPERATDFSHDDIFIDRNRCVLCARCVRASRDVDGKNVFQFVGRGTEKRIGVNAEANLEGTDASAVDKAVDVCPVGALMKKRVGFAVPVGQRLYDSEPIGSDIEAKQV
ncbi:MAG: 2Fe-2S iron-sulfur cluster binding domain-containing protein [Lentisphaerae bacterium]|jgi:[NiFe] hydrogenase diaphorase moiety small subunit|nr:2Fe-2S iron-sulfur cluster binding domain-containing protein [Lentisphaerota bacterium]MBT5609659.1 2Fe-2S iron-sulfur cluster binding domain-containing protein [Lentisphaerota bacterium]MBT7055259.1 2Fe-2S iron-sulfur cluster binding domain-containing protein [Lentisphaerota bacterium]MBT7841393.1 2Fe-2S iron-sulfur cluster binding domain-containing protein [Lentisphaerota bacterium]